MLGEKAKFYRFVILALSTVYLSGCLAAILGAGAFAGYAWKDKERNAGEILRDAKTTNVLKTRMMTSKELHAGKINVDTYLMHVILGGRVPCPAEKSIAEKMAWDTKGVVHVENILKVRSRPGIDCSGDNSKGNKKGNGNVPEHSKGKGKAKGR